MTPDIFQVCALCGDAASMECIACIRLGHSGFMCGASCLRRHFSVHREDKPPVSTAAPTVHTHEQAFLTEKPPQYQLRARYAASKRALVLQRTSSNDHHIFIFWLSRQTYEPPSHYHGPIAREVPHARSTLCRTPREGLWSCSLAAHAAVFQPSSRHVTSTVLVKQR